MDVLDVSCFFPQTSSTPSSPRFSLFFILVIPRLLASSVTPDGREERNTSATFLHSRRKWSDTDLVFFQICPLHAPANVSLLLILTMCSTPSLTQHLHINTLYLLSNCLRSSTCHGRLHHLLPLLQLLPLWMISLSTTITASAQATISTLALLHVASRTATRRLQESRTLRDICVFTPTTGMFLLSASPWYRQLNSFRPFICPEPKCGKDFIQRSALTVHIRTQ